MEQDRVLLLSLRPRFADLILAGSKQVELRRIRPKAAVGMPVVVYASSPTCALVGTCRVAAVSSDHPDVIWHLHNASIGVGRREFDEYFIGAEQAVAITVESPRRLTKPVPLASLRNEWPRFHPPQSFRYIGRDVVRDVLPQGVLLRHAAA